MFAPATLPRPPRLGHAEVQLRQTVRAAEVVETAASDDLTLIEQVDAVYGMGDEMGALLDE